MNKIIPNTSKKLQGYLFVFAAMLLVSLTSCTVKGSIKTMAGIPIKSGHSLPKGHQGFSVNTLEKCAGFEAVDTQIVQKIATNTNDLLPVVLFTATLFFLFSFRTVIKEKKHPLYSGSRKISNSIPIFLEYRKLIIPFPS